MLEKIIEIAKGCCNKEIDWNGDVSIVADMELNSLDFFEFISNVEETFGIRISERQLSKIDTLGELVELIQSQK